MNILLSGMPEYEFKNLVEPVLERQGLKYQSICSQNRREAQEIIRSQWIDLMFLGGTTDLRNPGYDADYESGRDLARNNSEIPSIMLVYPIYQEEWLRQTHPPSLTMTFTNFQVIRKETLEKILAGENLNVQSA